MKQFKRVGVAALFALIGFALFHYATESKTGSAAWTTEVATHHFKDILEAQREAIEAHTPLENIERTKLSHEDDVVRLLLGQRDWVEQFHYTIQEVQVDEKGGLLYANAYVTRNLHFESGVTTGLGDEMTIQLRSPNEAIEEVELDNHSVTQSGKPFFKRWISRVFD